VNSPDIVVKSRHVDLSARFREHVSEKLARVGKFGVPLRRIDVEVSKETNPRMADRAFEVELTCRGKGPVIRAEAAAPDKYAALDRAYTRLEERLRRQADRHRFHRHGKSTQRLAATPWEMVEGEPGVPEVAEGAVDAGDTSRPGSSEETPVFENGPVVVREKVHQAEPMTVEQALTEMELVGHDFFLFIEIESSLPSVVYRRRGYDYGLIRVDTADTSG